MVRRAPEGRPPRHPYYLFIGFGSVFLSLAAFKKSDKSYTLLSFPLLGLSDCVS